MLDRLIVAAAALSLPGIALTVASERLIRPRVFYTGEWCPDPPDALGLPYEEARIYTADGLDLQGWYFPARPGAPTILFMHGTSYSASDMWVSDERVRGFGEFLRGIDCNFLIFDYRGYGRNPGEPTQEGTYIDAAAALAWLYDRDDVDPATLFFYGFSLGTGIATELAVREPSAGLILRAPFSSVHDMIVERYPRLGLLLAVAPWLPLTNYDTLSKIRRLDRPLLVMHSDADKTIPQHIGRRVFDAAPEPKRWVGFTDAGHSDVRNDVIVPAVRDFVRDVVAGNLDDAEAERPVVQVTSPPAFGHPLSARGEGAGG